MIQKCKITETGRDINSCEFLDDVCVNNYGGFERIIKTTNLENGEKISRIAIAVKKTARNGVELNYCPFCGANIDTSDYGIKEA